MLRQQISIQTCLARRQTMRPWIVPWYSPRKAMLATQAPLRLMQLRTRHCHPSLLRSHAHSHPRPKHPRAPCKLWNIKDLYSRCGEAHRKGLDRPGASPGILCLPIKSRPRPRIPARGFSTQSTQTSRSHRYSILGDDHLQSCAPTVRIHIRTHCTLVCHRQPTARPIRLRG